MRILRHIAPLVAASWCAFATPALAAPPPAAEPEPTGLAVPNGESWGDEWFDEAARAQAAELEREMVEEAAIPAPPAEPAPVLAKDLKPERQELRIVPPQHGPADLEATWRARRDALLRQDAATAAEAETRLRKLLLELDVREVHSFAAAAVRESRKLEATAPAEARRRAELAHFLAPSLPLTHLQLLRAQLASDPTQVRTILDLVARTVEEILFRDPRSARLLALDLAAAAGGALLLGGFVALLLLVLAHARNVLHDFHHLFPRSISRVQTGLLLGLLVALPVALGFGPLVVAALLVAALWIHLDRGERGALGGWLALCALLPMAAGALSSRLAWDETPAASLYAVENAGDFRSVREILEEAESPLAHPATLFVAARSSKRLGDLDKAETLYDRALALRPRWPEAMVNLGNVRYLRGDLAGAESLYAKAIDLEPGLAPAYFDLSRVHYDRVNITLGQAARARAIELDPTLVERYAMSEKGTVPANQYLIDVPLPKEDLDDAAARSSEGDRIERQLASLLVGPMPAAATAASGALFVALLAAVGAWAGPRARPAHSCSRCGRPVCSACDPESAGGTLCGQCLNVYARRAAVDRDARERKERWVRIHNVRRAVWLHAAALTLAGPFVTGRSARGALFLLGGWTIALLALWPGGVVLPMYEGWPAAWKQYVLLPLVLPLLAISWRDVRGGR